MKKLEKIDDFLKNRLKEKRLEEDTLLTKFKITLESSSNIIHRNKRCMHG
jgi:hypothetical protein